MITILAIVYTDLLVGVIIGLGTSFLRRNVQGGVRVQIEESEGAMCTGSSWAQKSLSEQSPSLNTLDSFGEGDHILIDAGMCDDIDPDVLGTINDHIVERPHAWCSSNHGWISVSYPVENG